MKKLIWKWKKFWGKRYYLIEDEKEIGSVLVYGHKVYLFNSKGSCINNEKNKKND